MKGGPDADLLTGGAGRDRLRGLSGDDLLQGLEGRDRLRGGPGDDLLEGGPGRDRLWGGAGDDRILSGPGRRETLYGGPGDDMLRAEGRGAALHPGEGADLVFGAGDALLSYWGLEEPVHADLRTGRAWGPSVSDRFSGVAALGGGLGDDRLRGGARSDWEGFIGGPGDDLLAGRGGYDEAVYRFDPGDLPLLVDLEAGTARDPSGGLDRLRGIEAVTATARDDRLLGGGSPFESFRGLAGDDWIDGRGGADRVDHSLDFALGGEAGVRVDLARGRARDGFGDLDRLRDVEGARGGPADDRLRGDRRANMLAGEDGDDRLFGRGGRDRLDGGPGRDRLEGGRGGDLFLFDRGDGRDRIVDFLPGRDHLRLRGWEEIDGFHELDLRAQGEDTLILLPGGDALRLDGVAPEALDSDDVWLV